MNPKPILICFAIVTGSPKIESCRHQGDIQRWAELSETVFPDIPELIAQEANPPSGQAFRIGFLFDLELVDEAFHVLGKLIGAEILRHRVLEHFGGASSGRKTAEDSSGGAVTDTPNIGEIRFPAGIA
tara:strand:+ start:51 stop:434 length:384 start_codon:yes stop_codon:yes gene_type:complete